MLRLKTEGVASFISLVKENEGKTIIVLFSGGKTSSGQSWCPDCVTAEPVIEESLANAPDDAVFIYCSVGDRTIWKDPKCEFRTHPQMKLTGVPTLLLWGTPKRLVEEQCQKKDLVDMFIEEI